MILLSFDTEEFDVPNECGVEFSLEDGMMVSIEGTNLILDVLKKSGVKATFFCTENFVKNAPSVMKRIIDDGHEVAYHGVDNSHLQKSDLKESKQILETEMGIKVLGYRQHKMLPVNDDEIASAGYIYNSSLNPTIIPGRYMHLNAPRRCFMKGKVLQIPASVSPLFRIPLFWLALHNFPEKLYYFLTRRVLSNVGYFVTYFHPWEFVELKLRPEWKIPFIIKNNSGQSMCDRLERLINTLKKEGHSFVLYKDFAQNKIAELSK